jgi:hypothetical protein
MISAYEIIMEWHESSLELAGSWDKMPGFAFTKSDARTTAAVLGRVLKLMEDEKKTRNEEFIKEFRYSMEKKEEEKSIIERLGLEDM